MTMTLPTIGRPASDPVSPQPSASRLELFTKTWRGQVALLAATALLYLWGLGASGTANDFYAAAVQAGTQSWKAMLFGSLDAGTRGRRRRRPARRRRTPGQRTRCRTARRRGPRADAGRDPDVSLQQSRRHADAAARRRWLLPDPRTASGRTRWVTLTGVLLGQALLVLPAFGLAYLLAAPTSLRRQSPTWSAPVSPWSPAPAPVGGWRSSSCGPRRPARTSAARPTTASCNWLSATTASEGCSAKVKALAVAKYPAATVERVETDSDGVYEAHVRLADGSQVIVQVGKAFTVTGVQTMGTAPSGVAGPSSTTG